MFVAVAGNIGAGKSSLTEILARRYALLPVLKPWMKTLIWKTFIEICTGTRSFADVLFGAEARAAPYKVNPAGRVIQDRTIFEDANIFARNLFEEGVMDKRDYRSYCNMYRAILHALRPPDLLIYLRASLPTLRARIARRSRSFETSIAEDYLARLNRLYDAWIDTYDLSPQSRHRHRRPGLCGATGGFRACGGAARAPRPDRTHPAMMLRRTS